MPVEKPYKFAVRLGGEEKIIEGTWLVATQEENLASLKEYPFFIAVGDYFATGEGQSYFLYASRAGSLDGFKEWINVKLGDPEGYFARGFDFFKNELPPESPATTLLATPIILSEWKAILAGEKESGHYEFSAQYHQNLS